MEAKYFEDIKEGDLIWIGWADESRGLFGNIRQIPVLKILYSNSSSDNRMFLRFAPDNIYDIEFMDSAVYPHSNFDYGMDTTPLVDGKKSVCSWISTDREEVVKAVKQDVINYIQQKEDDLENIKKKIEKLEKILIELNGN